MLPNVKSQKGQKSSDIMEIFFAFDRPYSPPFLSTTNNTKPILKRTLLARNSFLTTVGFSGVCLQSVREILQSESPLSTLPGGVDHDPDSGELVEELANLIKGL